MEKKILFIIFSIVLISISPQVFADNYLDTLLAEKNAVQVEQQKIISEQKVIMIIVCRCDID